MGQATVTATTDERRWLSALRPLVLLGGFVLVWWFLMTGAAQADGGPDGGLDDTVRSATSTVERVVHRPNPRSAPADKARQHRTPVAHVAKAVSQRVDTVVAPVAAPVVSVAERAVENNVKPVTTRTTDTVRKVVKDVRSGLENGTVVTPELNPDELVVPPLKTGESSARVDETRSNEARGQDFRTTSSMLPAAGVVTPLASPAAAFDAAPQMTATSGPDTAIPAPSGGVNSDGAASPTDHDGVSSVPSGNGGLLASDQNAQALVIAPAASTTSTVTSVDRLPAGPAYPPASSPD
jgi:hypothetical protein